MTAAVDEACILRGAGGAHRIEPGQCLTLGRHAGNDVVLCSSAVSRFHARLEWEGGDSPPLIIDSSSQNGTYVDDERVQGHAFLRHGSVIRIGEQRFVVELRHQDPALDHAASDSVRLFSEPPLPDAGRALCPRDFHRLLLKLEGRSRTGTLQLGDHPGGEIRLTLCLGRVVSVAQGQRVASPGRDELLALLETWSGPYRFRPSVDPHTVLGRGLSAAELLGCLGPQTERRPRPHR